MRALLVLFALCMGAPALAGDIMMKDGGTLKKTVRYATYAQVEEACRCTIISEAEIAPDDTRDLEAEGDATYTDANPMDPKVAKAQPAAPDLPERTDKLVSSFDAAFDDVFVMTQD